MPKTTARLRTLLGAEFDVVGWVENGADLIDAVARLAQGVTVADIAMPKS